MRFYFGFALTLTCLFTSFTFAADGIIPGSGTEVDPYLIEDFEDFQAFCADSGYWASGVYTRLECELDLDPVLTGRQTYTTAVIAPDTPNTSYNFDGIPFEGVFDGNGHIVSNLTIDTVGADNDYLGLFGKIAGSSAEIKNLGTENATITGGDGSYYLGGLCGYSCYNTITNCYATGAVTGGTESEYLGGLCGYNYYYCTISNCYATGAVTGGDGSYYLGGLCGRNSGIITNCYSDGLVTGGDDSQRLGGLCGYNRNGTISNCYATGSVTGGAGSYSIGGLCGRNWYSTISNCYATGSVTGYSHIGGLCGGNDNTTISQSYSTGSVVGSGLLGGLCGHNGGTIINCFWDKETTGQATSGGGWPMTTAQMKQETTYIGWNNGAWTINDGNNYPHLLWEGEPEPLITTDYPARTYSGDGISQPFEIATAGDLYCISRRSEDWDKEFVLKANIDMAAISNYCPVANFTGSFNGDGYIISNLTIDATIIGNYSQLGLFGRINDGGDVRNVGLINVDIIGGDWSNYFGGLCGYNYHGTISNCYATGSVTSGDDSEYLGGLCGENDHGTINNCYATGSVTIGSKSYYIGGLCGENNDGTITNCYATGLVTVTGGDRALYLGGLCGQNHGTYSTIINCYATSSVTGGCHSAGGLCGRNYGGSIIINCYAAGPITGGAVSYSLGGLCGENHDSTIINCYATGLVTGEDWSQRLGGLCGENVGYNLSSTINSCYSTGLITAGTNSSYLGGLCGYQRGGYAGINNCLWDIETSGMTTTGYNLDTDQPGTITNVVGKTTAQMQTGSTFTDAGWDFDVVPVWRMPFELPNYPMLGWQKDIPGDFTGRYGVDMVDFATLADTWSLSSGQAGYNDLCDMVDDDMINLLDLVIFADNWLENIE